MAKLTKKKKRKKSCLIVRYRCEKMPKKLDTDTEFYVIWSFVI